MDVRPQVKVVGAKDLIYIDARCIKLIHVVNMMFLLCSLQDNAFTFVTTKIDNKMTTRIKVIERDLLDVSEYRILINMSNSENQR